MDDPEAARADRRRPQVSCPGLPGSS